MCGPAKSGVCLSFWVAQLHEATGRGDPLGMPLPRVPCTSSFCSRVIFSHDVSTPTTLLGMYFDTHAVAVWGLRCSSIIEFS